MDIDGVEVFVRILVALGLGALIGAEREWRRHPAGVGTHGLVALGAAVFTLSGQVGVDSLDDGSDPFRVAAQVASGIGFIGAGAIIQSRGSVRGLTTAATLWFSAAVGVAAGVGGLLLATMAVAVAIFTLTTREVIGLGARDRSTGGYVVHVRHDGVAVDVATMLVEVPGVVDVDTHPDKGSNGSAWRTKVRLRDQESLEPVLAQLRAAGALEVQVERD
jgi:putative Mg2+ transporter-C (MgtC) family protein